MVDKQPPFDRGSTVSSIFWFGVDPHPTGTVTLTHADPKQTNQTFFACFPCFKNPHPIDTYAYVASLASHASVASVIEWSHRHSYSMSSSTFSIQRRVFCMRTTLLSVSADFGIIAVHLRLFVGEATFGPSIH